MMGKSGAKTLMHQVRVQRSIAHLGWISLLAVLIAVTPTSPAHAWTHLCGKFAGSSPPIGYKFANSSVTFNDRVREAADNWNDTSVPGTFFPDSSSDPNITVSSGSFASEGWWAEMSGSCSGGTWVGDEVRIKFNYSTTVGLSARDIRRVAVHELGHAYGLDHDDMRCGGVKKVMEQGSNKFRCDGTPPWNNDQEGVRAKY